MHPLASAILITWRRNGAYAHRLVADITPDQWTAQPVPNRILNHPAWIFSHLNVYAPICTSLARGESFTDPIDHRFGQKSEVSTNAADYSTGEAILAEYLATHSQAEQALTAAADTVFAQPNPLERWHTVHPTIGDMLVTLMVKHESGHLGQLSTWRRASGFSRVPM